MSVNMAMIVLTEHKGDSIIYLVPEFILDWVNQPYNSTQLHYSSYKEQLPVNVRDFFIESAQNSAFHEIEEIEDTVQVTIGSPENDRALQLVIADSFDFTSIVTAIKYAADNDFVIVDEFRGLCY